LVPIAWFALQGIVESYANAPVLANFQDYGFSGVIEKLYSMQSLQEALQRVRRTSRC
jgi:hypothetical protein